MGEMKKSKIPPNLTQGKLMYLFDIFQLIRDSRLRFVVTLNPSIQGRVIASRSKLFVQAALTIQAATVSNPALTLN